MSATSLDVNQARPWSARTLSPARASLLGWAGLGGVLALAAALRFANLEALGYANHYYTAAIKSMLQSWHNFFFVAAEPGGAVSVDKPPVGLWLQALSAYFLGVNGFAMVLPEILAGLASILVLFHLVRRSFGIAAGLLAALALSITPVVVATDRNNTIDSTLILTLLLAAWAFIKATETGRLRHLLLGAVLVGLGFNIKMLEAYLPLPAFYALYLLGSQTSLRRKVARLALATGLLLAVSLSWALVVDLTPPSQRPYVGSSGSNSVLSLALGYNGVERLTGLLGPRGARFSRPPAVPPQRGGRQLPPTVGPGGGSFPGTGRPGLLRLLTPPLSKEASWLLPFGLASLAYLLSSERWRWPAGEARRAALLWGGWLLAGAAFFTVANFFHEYYLSTIAPPLAALVGIGLVALWRWRERRPWLALGVLLAGASATIWLQFATATAYLPGAWWLPLAIVLLAAGAGLLLIAVGLERRLVARAGFGLVIAALLVTPAIWASLTTMHVNENQSLPSAYAGQASQPANSGTLRLDEVLLRFLQANTRPGSYLMAVPSSMQGADYVIATGRPVLYLGGFMGQDQVVTGDGLSKLVADGALRYIYWDARNGGRGFGAQSELSTWVRGHCSLVPGFEAATRNAGAPDGTGSLPAPGGIRAGPGVRGMELSLYDCGG